MKKTGLGSSAAMVTSIVSSLLQHFEVMEFPKMNEKEEKGKKLELFKCHNLAQFCHCLAQGKIGSGFDVSSACFGSQIYQRFSPSVLRTLLDQATNGILSTSTLLSHLNFTQTNNDENGKIYFYYFFFFFFFSFSVGQDVQIPTRFTWKIFQKLYILPNIIFHFLLFGFIYFILFLFLFIIIYFFLFICILFFIFYFIFILFLFYFYFFISIYYYLLLFIFFIY